MKKIIIISIFLLACFAMRATHIVGGEFALVEKRGGIFDLNLILYFDDVNGNQQAKDQTIEVSTFRKSDNSQVECFPMTLVEDSPVDYENPDCAIDQLRQNRMIYKTADDFVFEQSKYSDPGGYYVVWERCCRNEIITNIFTPGDIGMLFYMEFQALYDSDGNLTGTNSPVFNEIHTKYACLNEDFWMDFGATDVDGDSLTYEMADPIKGYTIFGDPIVASCGEYKPVPYPTVDWRTGYSADNAINGTPGLTLNQNTGLLTLHATESGLFVFSVICREFRNGKEIGLVQRDFQIYVNACDPNEAPTVQMENPYYNDTSYAGNTGFFYDEFDTIVINQDVDPCMEFFITDDKDPRNNENITVSVITKNFESSSSFGLEGQGGIVGGPGDTLKGIEMCWPRCEPVQEEPYLLDVIVSDDGCILPKSDTIHLIIVVEESVNTPPILTWGSPQYNYPDTLNYYLDTNYYSFDVFIDSLLEVDLQGTDSDSSDAITIRGVPQGFNITETSMSFSNVTGTGVINSKFVWQPTCTELLDIDDQFDIQFVLNDNTCPGEMNDTFMLHLNIKEIPREEEAFIPSNIFTPNGDNLNDIFQMPTLPKDNCGKEFVAFKVYNRWGRKVFDSNDRNFSWDGADVPDGTYYYVAEYTNENFKGYVELKR